MKARYFGLIAVCVVCLATAGAFAQNTKIGIVNTVRVFSEMQETKDLKAKAANEGTALQKESDQRQQTVKDLQAARDLLKADSPQYREADDKYMRAAIDFDMWQKIAQARLQGDQKQQIKGLFDKIVVATSEVAKSQNFDLVLSDQRTDMPENLAQVTIERLQLMLNTRNVLYSNDNIDLSNQVIAALDAKYKASGGPAPTGAAPAPAGGAPAPTPAK